MTDTRNLRALGFAFVAGLLLAGAGTLAAQSACAPGDASDFGDPGDFGPQHAVAPAATVPACTWKPLTFERGAYAGQDGRVIPLDHPFKAGRYYVHVGLVGRWGTEGKPKSVYTFGPKRLVCGHNYSAVMRDGGRTLDWRADDDPQLIRYAKPGDKAVVLARNEASTDTWYAIGLTKAGGGPTPVNPPPTEGDLVFDNFNGSTVENRPSRQATFSIGAATRILSIRNYHWNGGQGSPPGTVWLTDPAGNMYGPWPAAGTYGSGGAPDVYWTAKPGLVIPKGTYTINDSDPATWSQNAATSGSGMSQVRGVRFKGTPTPHPLPPGTSFESDTDRRGFDYQRLPGTEDAESCRDLCLRDGKCRAWTWVKPGVQEARGVCYLKDPAPAATRDTCCVSGLGATSAPPTHAPPPPPPPTSPPPTTPGPAGGWQLEGPPRIDKATYTPNDCYFGFSLDIADGSGGGTWSWADCTGASKCSGRYSGQVSWTKLPSRLEPGSKYGITTTASLSGANTCGDKSTTSSVHVYFPDLKVYADTGGGVPTMTKEWTVPKSGSEIVIRVLVTAAGNQGEVWYRYVYRK